MRNKLHELFELTTKASVEAAVTFNNALAAVSVVYVVSALGAVLTKGKRR